MLKRKRYSRGKPEKIRIITLFVALLTCLTPEVKAQGREFGIRAGAQAALTLNQGEILEEQIVFAYGGVFIGRPVGSTFFTSVISGIEYFQNGYKTDLENLRKLHYVGLPLALRFHFGPWHIQPGVSANFKIHEQLLSNGEDILSKDNRSSWFDLPIQLGVGVRITDVIVEARFHYGWMDVNKGNKNSYLQLGLAYSF